MFNTNVTFGSAPDKIALMVLPDGNVDMWLRKGIGFRQEQFEQGTYTVHFAREEAYARLLESELVGANLERDFDSWFERVKEWEPKSKTQLEEEISALKEQVDEQNALITALIGG